MPARCPETGAPFVMGGPLWAEPMHNLDWVQHILQHVKVIAIACCSLDAS